MTIYARIQDGLVAEIIDTTQTLADCFHPDIVAACVPCGTQVMVGWTYAKGKFSAPAVPVVTTSDLLAYAAARRFVVETGGYVFEGHQISTDRDSQSKIGSVALAANIIGSSFSTEWKCADGTFFTLDQADAIAMATAVMTFVSACFAVEASVSAAITAGTITSIAEIDAAAWPANS